ncbi:MAG TPA: glycosyltransferase [Microlunatus sp.]|nr:glycosyltransferase [Microlunatus sp.]
MPSYLLASVPIHGHVNPLLPIAAHLVARGDSVRFLTGARFARRVSATGATHVPLPPASDFDDRSLVLDVRAELSPAAAIAYDMEHVFIRPAEGQYAAVQDLIDGEPVDAIIVDPTFAAGALLVETPADQRPPVLVAGVLPLGLPSRGLAPFGLGLPPMAGPIGWLRNRALGLVTERVFRRPEQVGAELMRRTLGRAPSGPVLTWMSRADAVLQLSVPSFEYPRPDSPTRLEFTGMVTSSSALDHPYPSWWSDLDGGRPVVHVTQGTIANDDLTDLVLPTVRALADVDVLVVVATGGRPVAELGELPGNARAAEFLPYADLFARTDVFVTNGGYGGVQFALAHGVPVVVAPGKEDKVEVAARVAWSGAGRNLRRQRPDAARIRRAVEEVLSRPEFRTATSRIAAEMAAAPGAAGFAAVVDDIVAGRRPDRPVTGAPRAQRRVA